MKVECEDCKYAEWDYEEYYGTTKKQYFVTGCKLDRDIDQSELCEGEDGEYAESAQLGTNLAEVGTGCISRQAAIDAQGGKR